MGWTTRVGGKDHICHREDNASIIYLAGKTTMVGGTDHTHYREDHRLEMHLAGRTTDINGIDHNGWWEGPYMLQGSTQGWVGQTIHLIGKTTDW
jgi:hypothetical protein